MISVAIILSFLLEIMFSNIINISGIFIPLFLIVSLVLIYPYFNSKIYFLVTCLICGLIYDLGFYNSVFVNTICFTSIGLMIMLLHSYMNCNLVSTNLVNIIIIIFYRLVSYLLLCLIAYTNFHISTLFRGIYSSLLLNIIYGFILYLLLEFVSKKFSIKKNE